jgi:gamma-glutamyltranspeptidase/glutathione hydrolase
MAQAISAGHQVTLDAAKLILKEGGNAYDAAIAAYLAMFIAEPCMASAGAGGFAMCFRPGKPVKMLDFFTQTPASKMIEKQLDFNPIIVDFGNETETFYTGMASIAVPGAIAGIFALHKENASMPMELLVQPAKDLNTNGVSMDSFQSMDLVLLEPIFKEDPSMQDVFFPNGELLKKGDILKLPHYNDFLDFMVAEGPRGFYEGEISAQIDKDSKSRGGFIRRDDLKNYKTHWRKPIKIKKYGHHILLPNGPSLGGAIMAMLFHYQQEFSGNWVKSILEFQKQQFQTKLLIRQMEETYPNSGFKLIGNSGSSRGTSHFNILDKWGNAVALTSSIGEGCGYFIPGTDMHLNNMMGESALLPHGFHSWDENVRLHSMMTPTMALDSEMNLVYCSGSGGAGRIPFMIGQVLENVLKGQMPLEIATLSPRVYIHEGKLHFETGAKIDFQGNLPRQEWDYQSLFFGGVHSITLNESRLEASGDQRRYGVGEVFD